MAVVLASVAVVIVGGGTIAVYGRKMTVFWVVVPSGRNLPMFRRCLLPPSSGRLLSVSNG
jgi:hypothetical protein